MAITFARLMPILLTVRSGAVRVLAYIARTVIYDPRIQKLFDYTSLATDFACGGIILPEDHPPGFADITNLAVNLDRAEFRKVRTPLEERARLPQVGLALVVALPPDGELWLHEAAELMQRIVKAAAWIGGNCDPLGDPRGQYQSPWARVLRTSGFRCQWSCRSSN